METSTICMDKLFYQDKHQEQSDLHCKRTHSYLSQFQYVDQWTKNVCVLWGMLGRGADHCFTNEFCKEALKQSCEFMNRRRSVATIMELDRAIRCGNDTSEGIYDERDLLVR